MNGLATAPRLTAPPPTDAEAAEACKALDLADIADADLKAELDKLRAENQQLKSRTARDSLFRSKLRAHRDREKPLKALLAEERAAIKQTIDEWVKDWQPGLFDSKAPVAANGHVEPAVQPDDSWRQLPCGALQEVPEDPLSASMIVKLADNEVSTIGQLSDRMNAATEKGGQWFDNFAGVGPGKAELIEKALDSFWKANPKYCRSKVTEVAEKIGLGGAPATLPFAEQAAPESAATDEAAANGEAKADDDDEDDKDE
jgi:hypothetical protein